VLNKIKNKGYVGMKKIIKYNEGFVVEKKELWKIK
jgi:hypothetical protein